MPLLFVIDDQDLMRDSLVATFSRDGFTARGFAAPREALDLLPSLHPDVLLCDLKLPQMGGLEVLAEAQRLAPDLPVILITGYGTVATAVEAMKRGAFDYLCKPFDVAEIECLVKKAVVHRTLVGENQYLRAQLRQEGHERLVLGPSPAMQELAGRLPRIAACDGTILLTGESGVGKEVVARAIHSMSPRRDREFHGFSCAELSPSVLESELFGHERGAFTGAERAVKGWFETAHLGSLLLDEVTELPPPLQAKLLRVLQERVVQRIGCRVPVRVDVRVLATSNRDPHEAIREHLFRGDLFYRLNVLRVNIPPLRDRLEDLPVLVDYFLDRFRRSLSKPAARFTQGAMSVLRAYHWPGNVRELANLVERLLVMVEREEIDASDVETWLDRADQPASPASAPAAVHTPPYALAPLPTPPPAPAFSPASPPASTLAAAPSPATATAAQNPEAVPPGSLTLDELERRHIVAALTRNGGNRLRTARALGIGERTLRDKIKRWGLLVDSETESETPIAAQATLPWR
ncbi:MAG: sigma-54-dependent Fis family transcriptional regulator [Planctomycetes bacterium]|nr:sigma-54-dependent Fis family transcriptional regulator [Planctomycetota bacterium]